VSGHSPEAVKKQVRVYVAVFAALAVLTVLTVAVSYLHMPLWAAIAVALLVASVKGTLVAAFFMHLISEKKIIWLVLLLAIFFFFFVLLYPSGHAL
jgi:cytochrome c oxidase subunit IV